MLLFTTSLWARMVVDDVNQSQTCCHHISQKRRCTTRVYIMCRVCHQPQLPSPFFLGKFKASCGLVTNSRKSEVSSGLNHSPGSLLSTKMAPWTLTELQPNITLHSVPRYKHCEFYSCCCCSKRIHNILKGRCVSSQRFPEPHFPGRVLATMSKH